MVMLTKKCGRERAGLEIGNRNTSKRFKTVFTMSRIAHGSEYKYALEAEICGACCATQ